MLDVQQFSRKSFEVDAVQVTAENMEEVARWCKGSVHDADLEENPTDYPHFIKVRVDNPLTERQTQAYVTDWVLYAKKGYKVYTDKAFQRSFKAVAKNVFERTEAQHSGAGESLGSGAGSNLGGTRTVG